MSGVDQSYSRRRPLPDAGADEATKAERLARFRGPVEHYDAERAEYWARASPAAHANAMIELAAVAEMVVAHTGYRKPFDEIFPGFPVPPPHEC